MHIFIDETGTFTGIGQPNSISMIGALIVPDARLRSLEREYSKIRKYLPQESGEVKGLGMTFISEPMSGFWAPNDAEVNQIEAIMGDHSRRPIFVHCQHGEDRTGLIVGLYRVESEHWSPAAAYHEMIAKGFHKILFFLNHYYEERTGWED